MKKKKKEKGNWEKIAKRDGFEAGFKAVRRAEVPLLLYSVQSSLLYFIDQLDIFYIVIFEGIDSHY